MSILKDEGIPMPEIPKEQPAPSTLGSAEPPEIHAPAGVQGAGPQSPAPQGPSMLAATEPTMPPQGAGDQANSVEQQSYEEGMAEVQNILYKNQPSSDRIIKMIDPQNKVETTAKTTILLVQNMDKKLNFEEGIIYSITEEVAGRVIDLAEATGRVQFSQQEAQKALMASFEGIMEMFGGEQSIQESYNALAQGYSKEQIAQGQQMYEGLKGV